MLLIALMSTLFTIQVSAENQSPKLNNYTYQTTVSNSKQSCQSEADLLGQKFQLATNNKVEQAICRNEYTAHGIKYYSLGLVYKSQEPLTPYVAIIGKKTSYDFVSVGLEKLYPSLESCESDLNYQTYLYEQHTTFKAVSSTCDLEAPIGSSAPRISLRIEGFSDKTQVRPEQVLFHFAPQVLVDISDEQTQHVVNFVSSYNATVVKTAKGVVAYYKKDTAVPISAQVVAYLPDQAECKIQINDVYEIFAQAKKERSYVWCETVETGAKLISLFEGTNQITEFSPVELSAYPSLQDCLNDRVFVLKDQRYQNVIGAICTHFGPSSYLPYSMKLLKKSF